MELRTDTTPHTEKNEQLAAMLNNVGLNNVLSPTCSMFSTILFSNLTPDSVITILFNIVDNYINNMLAESIECINPVILQAQHFFRIYTT